MIFTKNIGVITTTGYFQEENINDWEGSISVEALITTGNNVEDNQVIYSHGTTTGKAEITIVGGNIQCVLGDSFSPTPCSPNTPYHIVMVNSASNSTKQLYINGISVESSVASPVTISARLVIGAVVGGTSLFKGSIHQVRVFNDALSLSNHSSVRPSVLSLWNGGFPQEYSITPDCKNAVTGTLLGEWLAVNASSSEWKNSSYRDDLGLLPKLSPTFETSEYTGIQVPWGDITNDLISIYYSGTSGKKRVYIESPMNYTKLDRSKTITISPADGEGNSATVKITQPMIGIGDMAIDVTFAIAQV